MQVSGLLRHRLVQIHALSNSFSCAAVWVFGYVISFPLLVFWKLLSYSRKLRQKSKDIGELRYGFLVSGLLSCTDGLGCC